MLGVSRLTIQQMKDKLEVFWGDREIETKEGLVWFRGDLSKREQPVQTSDAANVSKDIYYTAEELCTMFNVSTLSQITTYTVKMCRPRINGKKVQRYKIE